MRNWILPTLCLLVFSAGVARAEVLLGWGDSPTNGAPLVQTFDCEANTGTNILVISFVPVDDLHGVTLMQLDLTAAQGIGGECFNPNNGGQCYNPPLPPWWDMAAGGCRAGAISASAGFTGTPLMEPSSVVDPWTGAGFSWTGWSLSTGSMFDEGVWKPTSSGRLGVQASLPEGAAVDLLAGHEYYLATVRIQHVKSVGPGACDGCCIPVEFGPLITLTYAGGVAYYYPSNLLSGVWQGSNHCLAVPARVSTWGSLKSAYR